MKVGRLGPKRLVVILMSVVLCLALAPAVIAAGGVPAAHDSEGQDFGDMVSELAKTEPGAIADHVAECDAGGGMPAVHCVSGKEFGELVSGMAKTEPGAVAAHVADCAGECDTAEDAVPDCVPEGGMPSMHGLTGNEFGQAAAGLAQSGPGAVAAHIGAPVPCE
jgi:hypothetical protein